MPSGLFIQQLNARTIEREGTTVTLSNGVKLKAIVHGNDHELLRAITTEGDAPEKRPLVLIFSGLAWGVVLENMKVTMGAGTMARNYRVAPPLHPKWHQDVVTELAVVVFPDL